MRRSPLPYPPQVIKQAILELWQEECDGRLRIHTYDSLASAQGSVPHKLILICQGLNRDREVSVRVGVFQHNIQNQEERNTLTFSLSAMKSKWTGNMLKILILKILKY